MVHMLWPNVHAHSLASIICDFIFYGIFVISFSMEYFSNTSMSCLRAMGEGAIEASHPRLMRQFQQYAIITVPQPIAFMSIATCLASGTLCLFT